MISKKNKKQKPEVGTAWSVLETKLSQIFLDQSEGEMEEMRSKNGRA